MDAVANNTFFFSQLFDPKYLYIFVSGLVTVMAAASDRYNQPTFSKSKLVPFIQLPPARYLTTDSRYRNGLIIYLSLMCGLYTALCWIGPSILADPRIGEVIDQKYKDAALWPIGVAALLTTSTVVDDKRWIGKLEYFARQYAQNVAYIPAAVTGLAYSLRNMPIKLAAWSGELGKLREAFLRAVLGNNAYTASVATPPQEGAFANWIRANILFHSLTLLFEERISLRSDRSDVIARTENAEIFDRIKTHHEALRQKCPPDDQQVPNQNFEEIQILLKECSLLLASILSQMSRNPKELRDCLQVLGFGEIELDDSSNWATYCIMVVSAIVVGTILSFIALYLFALKNIVVSMTAQIVTEITLTSISAFILFTAVFVIGENLRDKWLGSGVWEESLGCYVKHVISTALWTSVIATILIGFVNSMMSRGQGVTILIPVWINSLLGAALAAGFFLVHMYQAARKPPSSIPWMFANSYAIAHGLFAAALLISTQIMIQDLTARSETSQNLAAARQAFSPIARNMTAETVSPDSWFVAKSSAKDVNDMSHNLDELADEWQTASKGWQNGASLKEPEVIQKRLDQLLAFCKQLNGRLKIERRMFVENDCLVRDELFNESKDPSDAAKKTTGDNTKVIANPYITAALRLEGAYKSLNNYKDRAGSAIKRQTVLFTGLVTLIIAFLFGVGCRTFRSWLLLEHRKVHRAGFAKLRDDLAKKRAAGTPLTDTEFELFLRTPLEQLGRMPPIEAMRYEDYRAKLFTLIDNTEVTLPQL